MSNSSTRTRRSSCSGGSARPRRVSQFERPCFQVLALQEAEAKYQNQVAALVKPPRFVGQESILAAVIQSQAIAQNANTARVVMSFFYETGPAKAGDRPPQARASQHSCHSRRSPQAKALVTAAAANAQSSRQKDRSLRLTLPLTAPHMPLLALARLAGCRAEKTAQQLNVRVYQQKKSAVRVRERGAL